MGKKRREPTSYDKSAFDLFVKTMSTMRQKMDEKGSIIELQIDGAKLEEVIKTRLEKGDRESIEKYFGLVPGTICHAKKKKKDAACMKMHRDAELATTKLFSIENLRAFDKNIFDVTSEIIRKVDKSNMGEDISDDDVLRYLKIFIIIFCGGPHLYWEEEKIDTAFEDRCQFDDLSVFMDMSLSFEELPEHSVDLRLLRDTIDFFDVKDKIRIKSYVGLDVEKEYKDFQEESPNMGKIRSLKERLFPLGEWTVTTNLIVYQNYEQEEFPEFYQAMESISRNWKLLDEYITVSKSVIYSSKGEKQVVTYKIGELEFTDTDEILALYLNWLPSF